MTEKQGIADEAEALAALPLEEAIAKIPDAWIDELAVVGTPVDCARKIASLAEAGATAISLCLAPDASGESQIDYLSRELLPLVRRGGLV